MFVFPSSQFESLFRFSLRLREWIIRHFSILFSLYATISPFRSLISRDYSLTTSIAKCDLILFKWKKKKYSKLNAQSHSSFVRWNETNKKRNELNNFDRSFGVRACVLTFVRRVQCLKLDLHNSFVWSFRLFCLKQNENENAKRNHENCDWKPNGKNGKRFIGWQSRRRRWGHFTHVKLDDCVYAACVRVTADGRWRLNSFGYFRFFEVCATQRENHTHDLQRLTDHIQSICIIFLVLNI